MHHKRPPPLTPLTPAPHPLRLGRLALARVTESREPIRQRKRRSCIFANAAFTTSARAHSCLRQKLGG
jgi:hypothetical protein